MNGSLSSCHSSNHFACAVTFGSWAPDDESTRRSDFCQTVSVVDLAERAQPRQPCTHRSTIAAHAVAPGRPLDGSQCWAVSGEWPVWVGCFFFTSAAIAGRLPWRQAAFGLVALAVVVMLVGRSRHGPLADGISAVLMIVIIGLAVITVVRAVTANRDLRAEREEMTRFTAVMEVWLRIARDLHDLHDLLGHNLSLIALKSELAGRLIDGAPQRAAAEIGEIEGVARRALQEVRDAVSAYRQPSLAGELRGAKEILALAGIACQCDADEQVMGMLPSTVEGVLAWAVREGVTNVIRHSNARTCRIRVALADEGAQVDVMDDGAGLSPHDVASLSTPVYDAIPARSVQPAAAISGNGLRGLAERVNALNGRFDAGPCAGGGFRLAVLLPLGREVASKRLPVPSMPQISPAR